MVIPGKYEKGASGKTAPRRNRWASCNVSELNAHVSSRRLPFSQSRQKVAEKTDRAPAPPDRISAGRTPYSYSELHTAGSS